MRKFLITCVAATLGVAGSVGPAAAEGLSATRQVIAVLGANLYVGSAEGHLNGAGTLSIHQQDNLDATCTGEFTSSAALGGMGQLRCSDGSTATFRFQRLSIFRGYGGGSHTRGPMSFTYGLSADQSERYLALPPGKKLQIHGNELALVDF